MKTKKINQNNFTIRNITNKTKFSFSYIIGYILLLLLLFMSVFISPYIFQNYFIWLGIKQTYNNGLIIFLLLSLFNTFLMVTVLLKTFEIYDNNNEYETDID